MNSKNIFNQILDDQDFCLENNRYDFIDDLYSLSTNETVPDDRIWKSNIEDIEGGDNFIDYCTYIFNVLEDVGYYD